MQPFWSSTAGAAGGAQVALGSPAFTHTNTLHSVPLSLTTTTSVVACALVLVRAHIGLADMSMTTGAGLLPANTTLPVIVAPLISSTTPAGGVAEAVSRGGAPPQAASSRARQPIQSLSMDKLILRLRHRGPGGSGGNAAVDEQGL